MHKFPYFWHLPQSGIFVKINNIEWYFLKIHLQSLSPKVQRLPLGSLWVLYILQVWTNVWWHMDFSAGSTVKNLLANAGDLGLIPGSGISPGEENDNPFHSSHWEIPRTEETSRLQFMGHKRVRYDLASKQQQQIITYIHHYSVIQGNFLKIVLKILLSTYSSLPLTRGNHWSFYWPHNFLFSRMPYSWNHKIAAVHIGLFHLVICI